MNQTVRWVLKKQNFDHSVPSRLFLQHVTDISEYDLQQEEHQIMHNVALRIRFLWN